MRSLVSISFWSSFQKMEVNQMSLLDTMDSGMPWSLTTSMRINHTTPLAVTVVTKRVIVTILKILTQETHLPHNPGEIMGNGIFVSQRFHCFLETLNLLDRLCVTRKVQSVEYSHPESSSCWSLDCGSVDWGRRRVIRCGRTLFRLQKGLTAYICLATTRI